MGLMLRECWLWIKNCGRIGRSVLIYWYLDWMIINYMIIRKMDLG